MTNGIDPDKMTSQERMAEVSMLLSMAMLRRLARRKERVSKDNSLGFEAKNRLTVTAGKP